MKSSIWYIFLLNCIWLCHVKKHVWSKKSNVKSFTVGRRHGDVTDYCSGLGSGYLAILKEYPLTKNNQQSNLPRKKSRKMGNTDLSIRIIYSPPFNFILYFLINHCNNTISWHAGSKNWWYSQFSGWLQ